MASTSETGHKKNLVNLKSFISSASSWQSAYNPARQALTVQALQQLLDDCTTALDAVGKASTNTKPILNERAAAFKDIKPFSTSLVSNFSSFGFSKAMVANAETLQRKLTGERATPLKKDAEGKEPGHKSVSQLSYENMQDNFKKLVDFVTAQTYTPNEAHFTAAQLLQKVSDLDVLNTKALAVTTALETALQKRDDLMYAEETGAKDIFYDAKDYVKGTFRASSAAYKQIRGLSFKIYKR